MPVQPNSLSNVRVNGNIDLKDKTNPSSNNKGALREKISDVKNSIENISSPILYTQNTHSDKISIKIEGLKSSITNISSFHTKGLSLSKDSSDKFLAPNPDKETTRGQSKLSNIKLGKKVEIPKISAAQIAALSNEKKEDEAINSQVKDELDNIGKDSQKSEVNSLYRKDGAYNKMSKRYDLNSSNFSPVKNLIDDKKISTEKKERELKKYLARNDSEMKRMNKFEKFKDIFGMSKKINILRNQQNDDIKIIFNGLSSLHNSIVNKDIS